MINENEFVVPSAAVPPTQVGIVVRTEEDEPAKTEGDAEQQSASSGPADLAIVGAVARRRIFANEPISPDQLIQRGDRSIGAAVVSPGMRAVSIKIKPETASAGFIAPGDYVDVMLSIEWKIEVVDENGRQAAGRHFPDAARRRPDGRRFRPRRCCAT